jgi:hypothetical protein
MVGNFRNSFLSNYLSQPLDIWHTALTHGPYTVGFDFRSVAYRDPVYRLSLIFDINGQL